MIPNERDSNAQHMPPILPRSQLPGVRMAQSSKVGTTNPNLLLILASAALLFAVIALVLALVAIGNSRTPSVEAITPLPNTDVANGGSVATTETTIEPSPETPSPTDTDTSMPPSTNTPLPTETPLPSTATPTDTVQPTEPATATLAPSDMPPTDVPPASVPPTQTSQPPLPPTQTPQPPPAIPSVAETPEAQAGTTFEVEDATEEMNELTRTVQDGTATAAAIALLPTVAPTEAASPEPTEEMGAESTPEFTSFTGTIPRLLDQNQRLLVRNYPITPSNRANVVGKAVLDEPIEIEGKIYAYEMWWIKAKASATSTWIEWDSGEPKTEIDVYLGDVGIPAHFGLSDAEWALVPNLTEAFLPLLPTQLPTLIPLPTSTPTFTPTPTPTHTPTPTNTLNSAEGSE